MRACTIFGPAAARSSRTQMSRTRQREWRGNWRGVVIGKNTYVLATMAKNPGRQDLRGNNYPLREFEHNAQKIIAQIITTSRQCSCAEHACIISVFFFVLHRRRCCKPTSTNRNKEISNVYDVSDKQINDVLTLPGTC